jgi:hypothetical protein
MNSSDFLSHTIHDKLVLLINRLNDNETIEKIDLEKLDQFKISCEYTIEKLKHTIPTLIQQLELDAVSVEFENALIQLNNYLGSNNQGHLTNSINHIFSALQRIKFFPQPFSKSDFNFSRVISSFQQTYKLKLDELELLNSNLQKKLDEFEIKIASYETNIKELDEEIQKKDTEIAGLSSNQIKEFEILKLKFTTEYNESAKEFKSDFEEKMLSIQNDANSNIEDIKTKLEEAKKLVNIIGDVAITGNYQQIANNHKKSANTWRWISISIMSVLSILLILSIWRLSDPSYSWNVALVKVIAVVILIYPATYASRESAMHRKLEIYNRKLELELASINPFIETFDEASKKNTKEKLVDRYFGNNDIESSESKNDLIPISSLEKISDLLINIISKKNSL